MEPSKEAIKQPIPSPITPRLICLFVKGWSMTLLMANHVPVVSAIKTIYIMTIVIIAEKLKLKLKSANGICGMLNHLACDTGDKSKTPMIFAAILPAIKAMMTEAIRNRRPF